MKVLEVEKIWYLMYPVKDSGKVGVQLPELSKAQIEAIRKCRWCLLRKKPVDGKPPEA
jgi:hypothetical protein